jgi:hypothetical protein
MKTIYSRLLLALTAALATLLGGCASNFDPAHYANETPKLEMEKYFNGTVDAWGIFQDRSGKVVKRFTVVMKCNWEGDKGTLDEDFTYSDGTKQKRVWTLKRTGPNQFIGTAPDVIGEAVGTVSGNALHWNYVLDLPVGDKTYHVNFDDLMILQDDQVMLNRAIMSKWGIYLGSVTLSFKKRL